MLKQIVRFLVAFTLIIVSGIGQAGHGVGTGGDYVRASFLSMGRAVIQYLDESDAGIELKQRFQLDSELLLKTLDINVVEVRSGILLDNLGSEVDALGTKDSIILSQDRWAAHLASDRDVYFLVFHEMLRAAGVNDDNYVISKSIQSFPSSRKIITRIGSLYPIVGDMPLDQIIDVRGILVAGSGCSSDVGSTLSDVDLERNILSVAFRRFDVPLIKELSGRKACTVVIPVKAPVGKRLVISQFDFSAKILLSAGAQAGIATDASFGTTGVGVKVKDFRASVPTQGRLFLRSSSAAVSKCDGTGQLLKVRIAGSAQKPASAAELNQLIGDSLAVSFAIEDCKSTR